MPLGSEHGTPRYAFAVTAGASRLELLLACRWAVNTARRAMLSRSLPGQADLSLLLACRWAVYTARRALLPRSLPGQAAACHGKANGLCHCPWLCHLDALWTSGRHVPCRTFQGCPRIVPLQPLHGKHSQTSPLRRRRQNRRQVSRSKPHGKHLGVSPQ